MPSHRYLAALELLDADCKDKWTIRLRAFASLPATPIRDWQQVAENITSESALPPREFSLILQTFVAEVDIHADLPKAWEATCSKHSFCGAILHVSDRPQVIGRAAKLPDYAQRLEDALGTDQGLKTLRKFADRQPATALRNLMGSRPIGGPIIFASFSEDPADSSPFAGLPTDTDSVRIAFGLGHHLPPEPYILFSYQSGSATDLPLHRPTVADAGPLPFFRPLSDEAAKWGKTHPLLPNLRSLKGRTDLVHKQITGANLVFPYQLTTS
jgi:hypothetical protein